MPRRALGAILTDAGIHESRHNGPMREVPPGLKLRVLLAQALFSRPDVLPVLDEPTNNLDINSIRWLESALNNYYATMVIISHDRHFLNQVCTHVADLDFQQLKIYPGNYDDFMLASVQARERVEAANAKAQGPHIRPAGVRAALFPPTPPKRGRRLRARSSWRRSRSRRSGRRRGRIRTSVSNRARKLYRSAVSIEKLAFHVSGHDRAVLKDVTISVEAGERIAIIGPNGAGQDHADALSRRGVRPTSGKIVWVENAQAGYMPQDPQAEFEEKLDLFSWMSRLHRQGGRRSDRARDRLGRLLFSGEGNQEAGESTVGRRGRAA